MDIINTPRMDTEGKGEGLKRGEEFPPTSGFSFVTGWDHNKVTRRRF